VEQFILFFGFPVIGTISLRIWVGTLQVFQVILFFFVDKKNQLMSSRRFLLSMSYLKIVHLIQSKIYTNKLTHEWWIWVSSLQPKPYIYTCYIKFVTPNSYNYYHSQQPLPYNITHSNKITN